MVIPHVVPALLGGVLAIIDEVFRPGGGLEDLVRTRVITTSEPAAHEAIGVCLTVRIMYLVHGDPVLPIATLRRFTAAPVKKGKNKCQEYDESSHQMPRPHKHDTGATRAAVCVQD